MRNPKRIHKVLELMRLLWTKYPDMRLNQLCAYVSSKISDRTGERIGVDLFMLEDDIFLEQLQIELKMEVTPVDPYHI